MRPLGHWLRMIFSSAILVSALPDIELHFELNVFFFTIIVTHMFMMFSLLFQSLW